MIPPRLISVLAFLTSGVLFTIAGIGLEGFRISKRYDLFVTSSSPTDFDTRFTPDLVSISYGAIILGVGLIVFACCMEHRWRSTGFSTKLIPEECKVTFDHKVIQTGVIYIVERVNPYGIIGATTDSSYATDSLTPGKYR